MNLLTLPGSGRETTRLGFGCSTIMGAMGLRESLELLEAAYSMGIRHFDTAPSYGFGASETCLGQFAKRHRDKITLTTKYGIPPPRNRSFISVGRRLAKPLIQLLPGAKARMSQLATAATRASAKASFSTVEARASLTQSLRNLQTDHIDLWLLHEATAEDLEGTDLLEYLQEIAGKGMIGTFGVGSSQDKIQSLYNQRRGFCRVLQFEWAVSDPMLEFPGSFRIHHRSLSPLLSVLCRLLKEKNDLCRRWSDEIGTDLSEKKTVAALMLKAALELNPDSVILFSSKQAANIEHNVEVEQNATLAPLALRFYGVIQSNKLSLAELWSN